MAIKITTLFTYEKIYGEFEVIHSLNDNLEHAKKEILETFNREYGENFDSIEKVLQYYNSMDGAGAYLSIQELSILTTKTAIVQ